MDKKKILEDGLLEQYLLGELDAATMKSVASAMEDDMELRAHFEGLEENFERIAFENGIVPPKTVRDTLEAQLLESEQKDEKQIRSLSPAKSSSKTNFLVAASIAAVLAFGTFWMYTQWQTAENNFKALESQTFALQERLSRLEKNYSETSNRYQQINNPNVIPLVLMGNEKAPNSKATAYVNHRTKQVILNAKGLRTLDEEHTYQMWADVEGEMINMGIVKTGEDYIILNYIDHAESLNITIEPAGGNDHPTVENLISNVIL